MGKILKYLSRYKPAIAGVILLLVIQAYCDLSLPQYMSDIVDIGIQQGGIAHVSPDEMRKGTLETLCLFLSEEDARLLQESYTAGENGNYKRNHMGAEELGNLDRILEMPLVLWLSLNEEGTLGMPDAGTAPEASQAPGAGAAGADS